VLLDGAAPTWWAAQAVAARTLLEWAKATADEEDAKAERLARSIEYFDEALRLLRVALRDDDVTAATDPADPANGAGGAAGAGACAEEELVELLNDRGVAHYEAALLESLMTSIIQPGTQLTTARESLLEALERRPGHARALTNLGLVEWCQGHERAAQQAFDRAIELGYHYGACSQQPRRAATLDGRGGQGGSRFPHGAGYRRVVRGRTRQPGPGARAAWRACASAPG
jgi:tetratricopeptide (TPR) repeat protein